MDAIQGHLTKIKPIQTDLFGHPTVRLKASDMAKGNTKNYVLQQLRELRKKDIDFSFVNPEGKTEDVTTGLINTVRSIRDTDFIDVEISTWAIPYLVYWGKGVGGTIYRKAIAVTLKSIYSKRLYKMCCRWQDRGGFSLPIDELREIFSLENKYSELYNLRSRVLDVAKKELKEKADLYFEYELIKIKSRSYNQINFKIFSRKSKQKENVSEWYQYVYNFITRTYPSYKDNKAMMITDKLSEDSSILRQAYQKFTKLDDEFISGKKNIEDIIKLTKYILKEDFDIK
jgi:plasmid replication initiation protein